MTRGSCFRESVERALLAPRYEWGNHVNAYLLPHMRRFVETAALLQRVAQPGMRIIDVGSYGTLVPVLSDVLGVTDVVCTDAPRGSDKKREEKILVGRDGTKHYRFVLDRFDLEQSFPYSDSIFDLAIFTEVLEHIPHDPMHVLAEINRITRPGGWIILTTPNCASFRSFGRLLEIRNPYFYPAYTIGASADRHNREYVPWEVKSVLQSAGYEVSVCRTLDVYDLPLGFVGRAWRQLQLLGLHALTLATTRSMGMDQRGDTIFALGRKTAAVQDRYPVFLYEQ